MAAVVAIVLVAVVFLPIYYLIVLWHGIGFMALIAIILFLFVRHLRKVFRDAKYG